MTVFSMLPPLRDQYSIAEVLDERPRAEKGVDKRSWFQFQWLTVGIHIIGGGTAFFNTMK